MATARKKTTKPTAAKSAPKKAPAKKTAKSKSVLSGTPTAIINGISLKDRLPKSLKLRKSHLIFILIIVIAAALLVRYRGVFVAAVVNGQPISRVEVVQEAEKQAGQQALQNIVRNTLIEQEAREKNITVSDQEINDEIKKVEDNLKEQGQELDQVLATQNLSREDLRKLIRLDKLVAKIVGDGIDVTDEEVSEYIETNREILPADQTDEELSTTVRENLRQQKLNEEVQAWLTELQAKAKIQYFVQY